MKRTGVTAARGFRASGVSAGIKKTGPGNEEKDLALVAADVTASVAAVFTKNLVQAAPIGVCRKHIAASGGRARAIVVNSGNANACTGAVGREAAMRTAVEAAGLLGVAVNEVLVASTGVIGQTLPVDLLLQALPEAVNGLSADGGSDAARAIMTTDTRTKQIALTVETPDGQYTVGGMAKGSGMIHPDMATTLAFVTTDAVVESGVLNDCLKQAVDVSFNRISVDGDTSTNDMVAVMANGVSGVKVQGEASTSVFLNGLTKVLTHLAKEVVRDGEGATRLVTVEVSGARDDNEALKVSRTVSTSPLVKTAVYGADANWGRIVGAVGRAGVDLDPAALTVSICGLEVLSPGYRSDYSEADAGRLMKADEVVISVDLGQGVGFARTWTCDLTHGYIDINASYRT
ncbi:MAG: bifunctional glutamate N-acetyltransferase/amino-acid acetyltransferase ArgJ [Deltaproteobacteria bacterium]|nr:bifunctional glutamate N-acetyltransferase/amino-acid acetyltransferase ArgJ [Deltaproteobacteria bacterium]